MLGGEGGPVGEQRPGPYGERPAVSVFAGVAGGGQNGLGLEGIVQLVQTLVHQAGELLIHLAVPGDGVELGGGVIAQAEAQGLGSLDGGGHRRGGGYRVGHGLAAGRQGQGQAHRRAQQAQRPPHRN